MEFLHDHFNFYSGLMRVHECPASAFCPQHHAHISAMLNFVWQAKRPVRGFPMQHCLGSLSLEARTLSCLQSVLGSWQPNASGYFKTDLDLWGVSLD